MNWYWRVRIYNKDGQYRHGQIVTGPCLREIDGIQDFYAVMTGCKMLLEGMSEREYSNLETINEAFATVWRITPAERGGGKS